ncbi:hypothetical protein D047_4709B, partial [Vibrio parahaemolyticus VPTS-2010_2]
STA